MPQRNDPRHPASRHPFLTVAGRRQTRMRRRLACASRSCLALLRPAPARDPAATWCIPAPARDAPGGCSLPFARSDLSAAARQPRPSCAGVPAVVCAARSRRAGTVRPPRLPRAPAASALRRGRRPVPGTPGTGPWPAPRHPATRRRTAPGHLCRAGQDRDSRSAEARRVRLLACSARALRPCPQLGAVREPGRCPGAARTCDPRWARPRVTAWMRPIPAAGRRPSPGSDGSRAAGPVVLVVRHCPAAPMPPRSASSSSLTSPVWSRCPATQPPRGRRSGLLAGPAAACRWRAVRPHKPGTGPAARATTGIRLSASSVPRNPATGTGNHGSVWVPAVTRDHRAGGEPAAEQAGRGPGEQRCAPLALACALRAAVERDAGRSRDRGGPGDDDRPYTGRRVVHDILHDQMSSPALLAWLFGERYGFGSPWRVTRKCLRGGIYGRSEPLPEGATGSAGVGCQGIRPSCRARAAASVRLAPPSLPSRWVTCFLTVSSDTKSSRAMRWFDEPAAISRRASVSASVSAPRALALSPRAASASAPVGMISNGRGYQRKIPLPCHLRVTPSPCVRSYRPQMKETLSAGRTGMAAPRPARAQQGNCRSLPRAQSAPPGMTRSAAAARRWLELA